MKGLYHLPRISSIYISNLLVIKELVIHIGRIAVLLVFSDKVTTQVTFCGSFFRALCA